MSSRRAQRGMNLQWFRANQIGRARHRFIEGGGENVECLVLQQIWNYKEKALNKKRNKETDRMIENILKHANPEWREQRSTCAKILDPKNHDKMKRRRAGEVHTNWDEMEWLSKMGEVSKTLEKLCENS